MKYAQGIFIPKNPQKIVGKQQIQYRSAWELRVMSLLDQHPDVINWASESIAINYIHPLDGKQHRYIPDLLVTYKDKNGKLRSELIEIKPAKEALKENSKSKKDKAVVLINTAKFTAAMLFCKKHGLKFTVLTENDIWINKGSQIKKRI